ncbi:MAG: hypothetical protein ABI823_06135 [Bryobacteraceae bacterium]
MNKSRRLVAKFGLIGLLLSVTPAAVMEARGRWEYLGESNVDGLVDHDLIRVGARDGRFRAIQMKVQGGAIEFNRVVIHYGNGRSEPIEIRQRIPAGGQTRVIDLPGERRAIEGVEFFYQKARWTSRKPKVRLFGMR